VEIVGPRWCGKMTLLGGLDYTGRVFDLGRGHDKK
jgi:hypothetical protein